MEKQRERLIELLNRHCALRQEYNDCTNETTEDCSTCLADFLLANGVILPPCKVGDTVYFTHRMEHRITEHRVDNLYIGKKDISIRMSGLVQPAKPHEFGRIFFISREEAEAALKGEA